VYTIDDPRAVLLHEKASKLTKEKKCEAEFRLYDLIAKISPDVLAEVHEGEKKICPNVDFYSGFVYSMLTISRVNSTRPFLRFRALRAGARTASKRSSQAAEFTGRRTKMCATCAITFRSKSA
jgi:hypothetical protein